MVDEALEEQMREFVTESDDEYQAVSQLSDVLHELTPVDDYPISNVQWVPLENVKANSYNPNQVDDSSMSLLYKSIKEDGYTQPVVVVEDETHEGKESKYVIVDGFHRYITMKRHEDIRERSNGHLPVTIIDKTMNEQRAATVRHNRASGTHTTAGKSEVVFEMLDDGWEDERICEELGMEPEELARLKHTSGFAKMFSDADYSQPWKATSQLEREQEFPDVDQP